MSKVDWSKAPEWAECVVIRTGYQLSDHYHWSELPRSQARMMKIETGTNFLMSDPAFWLIVEHRPVGVIAKTAMTTMKWDDFENAPDWANCVVLNKDTNTFAWSDGSMYAPILRNPPASMGNGESFEIVAVRPMEAQPSNTCAFTPADQPSTAPELLNHAAQLLAERGKQYDKSGEERSAAAIVNAFNAITKRDLTPGEGWLFLVLLKAVRFYSNTETPHRDSLEDMIAYVALHAEEYLNDK